MRLTSSCFEFSLPHRCVLALLTALAVDAWIGSRVSIAEETFPFPAFVAHDRTQLRSGPGDDHYATEELTRGTEVEVHQRVEGGWLAVRPPSASFSWVSQRDIQLPEGSDVGEVVGSAAVSWIGTSIGEVADLRWLVKLNPGEAVNVIGKERRRVLSQGKTDVFYKIAPPAGEFRWLHEDDLVREKEQLAAIKDPAVSLADFRVALRGSPRPEKTTVDSEATEKGAEASKKDSFVSRDKHAPASRGPAAEVALLPSRTQGTDRTKTPGRMAPVPTPELETRLRELEAELSLMASQPADSWNFTALRASAEDLAHSGQSTLDRARVQLFLDKIAEFEGLKSRHALMAPKPALPSKSLKPTKGASSTKNEPGTDPRFDGTGWLLPVHSSKQSSPPYALLDKDGNILQFVSPAPGLNLNRYVRKEIGVFGQKDQSSTLDKPHLTAHRIVELDRHRK